MCLLCPGGLMDKVADSGSADAGSIPVRDARKKEAFRSGDSENLFFHYPDYFLPFPEFFG